MHGRPSPACRAGEEKPCYVVAGPRPLLPPPSPPYGRGGSESEPQSPGRVGGWEGVKSVRVCECEDIHVYMWEEYTNVCV